MNWYIKVLKQYLDFSGRARRKEYWMFILFQYLIFFGLAMISVFLELESGIEDEPNEIVLIIAAAYFLITLIPWIAVTIRRLHDSGKTGWLYLLMLIPYLGRFVILIFTCMDSEKRANKWGQNPKGIGNDKMIQKIGKE